MLSVSMLPIVAARSFDPHTDALAYLTSPTSPLRGSEAIPIKKGQMLYAIGYDPDHALFFATNCKQMPFCSIATTGYIPRGVFHPVQGLDEVQRPLQEDVEMHAVDESPLPPEHSASLSTPASSAHGGSASELDEGTLMVVEKHWNPTSHMMTDSKDHVSSWTENAPGTHPHRVPAAHPHYP